MFTHLRYEDHHSYEDWYLVLVNFKAPNGLKRRETCLWTVLTVVLVNHLKVCVKWWSFKTTKYGFQAFLKVLPRVNTIGSVSQSGDDDQFMSSWWNVSDPFYTPLQFFKFTHDLVVLAMLVCKQTKFNCITTSVQLSLRVMCKSHYHEWTSLGQSILQVQLERFMTS